MQPCRLDIRFVRSCSFRNQFIMACSSESACCLPLFDLLKEMLEVM